MTRQLGGVWLWFSKIWKKLQAKMVAWVELVFDRYVPADDGSVADWLEGADRAILDQEPVRTRALLYTIVAFVLALLIWAAFAEVDEVTRGEGRVIPSTQVQILQSLDGGVVTQIHVREGEIVEPGQLLVNLDATRFESTLRENQAEVMALKAKAERLRAVAEDRDYVPSEELQQLAPELIEQEMALFASSRDELIAEKAIASQQLIQRQQELVEITSRRDEAAKAFELASRELIVTRPLMASGAVSEVELLRLEREVSSLRGERDQARAQVKSVQSAIAEAIQKRDAVELEFKNRIREELSTTAARLSTLQESKLGLSDRVKMTEVRSPVRGTIKRLYFNTIGGVVTPGKEVVEIVPLDDSLLLEARIKPQDIAFLGPNQEAMVKFTAYDFVVYGGLEAVVEHIGVDTEMDEDGNPYYPIHVRTHEASLGEDMPIIPGMVAQVDILTGKKTILAYLLKPVSRARQYALTER
ncbi:MAG: HlyD family type I secretion periplasmic adaptor subunit [Candidatus Pelagadaptatus aseana]|uniref:HlyD family type I secretion periplasmic adaptor subunit n=1 Tax=Candidatus Pelagadaptatus aseana TaxID=3120508 RepID=UPI0039B180B5